MQTSHTMNALLSPHRMPIHQPDITYRTRFAAYSARDTAFIYMETPCTNDKTDKQRIHNIRFQPGSTALMHIPDPLPCNDIFGNRSDSMPCVLYLLEAKRPIVQIEHRYIGIGLATDQAASNGKSSARRFIPFPISSPHVHTA